MQEKNLPIDDVLNTVTGDVPEPSPIADRSPEAPIAPEAKTDPAPMGASETGKRGRGRPKLTPEEKAAKKAQRAYEKNDGRKNDFISKPQINGVHTGAIPPNPVSGAEGIEPAAMVAVSMINFSGMALGGKDAAMLPEEALLAKDGFVTYFKAKGLKDIPPSMMLLGAIAPYYLRIFTSTPAKGKLSLLMDKGIFGIKHLFKRVKNARADRRDNNERQDNSSEKTSS